MKFSLITRHELLKEIPNYLKLIRNWKYCDWTEENFCYELPLKWDFSFSVYSNNALVGFCFASNKIADVYYIHLLFISPDLRGNLLGSKILQHAQEIARKHNIHKLELRCPESNEQALNFYLKNGFTIKQKIKDDTSGNEMDYYLVLNV